MTFNQCNNLVLRVLFTKQTFTRSLHHQQQSEPARQGRLGHSYMSFRPHYVHVAAEIEIRQTKWLFLVCVCWLSFLFWANKSETWCGLLLLQSTHFKVQLILCSKMLFVTPLLQHMDVVFLPSCINLTIFLWSCSLTRLCDFFLLIELLNTLYVIIPGVSDIQFPFQIIISSTNKCLNCDLLPYYWLMRYLHVPIELHDVFKYMSFQFSFGGPLLSFYPFNSRSWPIRVTNYA